MANDGLPARIAALRDEALRYLASPAGQRLRHRTAWFFIVALPLVFRVPRLRRHWAIRLLELGGGAAVLMRLGEAIRDWQPAAPPA
jgi:hypothetical protein